MHEIEHMEQTEFFGQELAMKDKSYLRMMTAMMAEMHQNAGIDNGIDSKLVLEALWANQDWAIHWGHDALIEDETNPPEVEYVVSVLNMWRWIESVYERIDADAKERVSVEVSNDDGKNPQFDGFDGNEEGEYLGVARMLIDHLDRFAEFSGRDLNTHHSTTGHYESMLAAFERVKEARSLGLYEKAGADDLIAVLNAPYEPLSLTD